MRFPPPRRMPDSFVPASLVAAYCGAEYHVETEREAFAFRIRQHSPALARLLAETGQSQAFFVTGHNPLSEPQDPATNRAANARLQHRLEVLAAHVYSAVGTDPDGEWPPEPGYLALGVSLAAAQEIGREFRQNAIVWIGADAVPELALLR